MSTSLAIAALAVLVLKIACAVLFFGTCRLRHRGPFDVSSVAFKMARCVACGSRCWRTSFENQPHRHRARHRRHLELVKNKFTRRAAPKDASRIAGGTGKKP